MKKSGFLLLLILIASVGRAQDFGVSAGQFHVDFSRLNAHLKTAGAQETFQPIRAIGITGNVGLAVAKGGYFNSNVSAELFLPQRISINDSLHFRLNGWHVMTSLYGIDIVNRDHFAVVAGPGIDWGSMNMRTTSENGKAHYNNRFFAPFIRADVKFIVGKIAFGSRASYRYEFTEGTWENQEINIPELPDSKFSGLGLQLFICYKPPIKPSEPTTEEPDLDE
jgi:hypothetical protein